jgi:hypothetical protein
MVPSIFLNPTPTTWSLPSRGFHAPQSHCAPYTNSAQDKAKHVKSKSRIAYKMFVVKSKGGGSHRRKRRKQRIIVYHTDEQTDRQTDGQSQLYFRQCPILSETCYMFRLVPKATIRAQTSKCKIDKLFIYEHLICLFICLFIHHNRTFHSTRKSNAKELVWHGIDWAYMAQHRNEKRDIVNTAMTFQVL